MPFNYDITQRAAAPPGSSAGEAATVLLVEDEAAIRHLVTRFLTLHGYHVLSAESSDGALALWTTHKGSIQLLLTDMIMPGGLSGREVARAFQSERPGLKVLYTSGYDLEMSTDNGLGEQPTFVPKPFHPHQLLAAVRAALAGHSTHDLGSVC